MTCALATGSSYEIGVSDVPFDHDRGMAVLRLDRGAHPAERLRDALHRTRAQRLVTGQLEAALLAGEDPRQESHQRARVAAVDRLLRGDQAAESAAEDAQRVRVRLVDPDPQRADRSERRLRVVRATEAGDASLAVGDRPEQQRAVREGLVSGDADVPVDARRRDLHRVKSCID